MPPAARTPFLFLALAALTVATRWPSWGLDTLDWDEATFALAAQDVLRGHLPYTNTFDVKPPMIFLVVAGAFAAFGDGLLTLRGLGAALVLAGASLTALAALPRGRGPAFLGGALYVLACSAPFGQHTGTELLANVFVAGALCVLVRWPEGAVRAATAGLCLSLAVLTRNNLAVLPIGYGVWLVWQSVCTRRFGAPAAFVLAGLAPVAALFATYAAYGVADVLWLGLVDIPLAYAGGGAGPLMATGEEALHLVGWSARRPLGVLPLVLAAGIAGHAVAKGRAPAARLPAWFLGGAALSIAISGEAYSHYLLQLVPPAALLAALGAPSDLMGRAVRAAAGAGAALGAFFVASGLLSPPPETPLRHFADLIEAEGAPGDAVYAATGHLVLFYLDRPSLTPILHPSAVARESVAGGLAAAGYVRDPLGQALSAAPAWVVAPPEAAPKYLDEAQAARFAAFLAGYERRAMSGEYALYRRRALTPPAPQAPATPPGRPARAP